MKNIFASIILAMTTACASVGSAQAAVIDFNGLAGNPYPGSTYSYSGLYTFFEGSMSLQGLTFTPNQPHAWQHFVSTLDAQVGCWYSSVHCASNGTDYLVTSPSLVITRTDGGAFNLKAFDLGNFYDSDDDSAPAQSVFLVEAKRANGEIVSQTIMLDDIPNKVSGPSDDFNHFTFDGFQDITALYINGSTTRSLSGMALDNLDVTVADPNQVPEPASLALLGLGLAGLVRSRSRGTR